MKEPESTIDEEDKDMITDETIDLSTLNLDEFDDDNWGLWGGEASC